jgi:hypothetical protein
MLIKATLAAVISMICSPAICDELRAYTVTVMEQIRHKIIVVAAEESAARADALLETRRTLGGAKPRWEPSPPSMLSHAREAEGLAVITIEPVPARPGRDPGRNGLELVESP